ncbi:putative toxin-antitoxin system toxin component, PIN family [Rubrivirga sp. IMCC45206]|uniref:PIN domain-containing protein n=1 Tax=Rubrivirga sp. IMCC45206 TaxID=3391614 RepID=UPI003990148F
MRIVLDTNVLLPFIRRGSRLRWLFDGLIEGHFTLVVSTPILFEYEEVIGRRTRPEVARNVVGALLALPTVERVEPRFRWRLPPGDPDDEKFVDAALAAGADAVVTNDAHFDALAALDFPAVRVLTPEAFREALGDSAA